MFRWEKQKDGNFYAYSGQVVIGMAVKFAVPRADGATHVWNLSAVSGRTWLKTHGDVKSMASAKRAVKRCWTDWCEVHGLTYNTGELRFERRIAGLESAALGQAKLHPRGKGKLK
jgi:hypothetical protein